MKLNFYCSKCGLPLETPVFKSQENIIVDLEIKPCERCLKEHYSHGEKAAKTKIEMENKLKTQKNIELNDLIKETDYGSIEISLDKND